MKMTIDALPSQQKENSKFISVEAVFVSWSEAKQSVDEVRDFFEQRLAYAKHKEEIAVMDINDELLQRLAEEEADNEDRPSRMIRPKIWKD